MTARKENLDEIRQAIRVLLGFLVGFATVASACFYSARDVQPVVLDAQNITKERVLSRRAHQPMGQVSSTVEEGSNSEGR